MCDGDFKHHLDRYKYPQRYADAQDRAHHQTQALTLLLEPDIPWVADGMQRDGMADRADVHARIERVLSQWDWPYIRVSGSQEVRLLAAMRQVQALAG